MAGKEHTENVDTNNRWHNIKTFLVAKILLKKIIQDLPFYHLIKIWLF